MEDTLVNIRILNGLSQMEMAKKLGVSLSLYAKIEMGIRNPSYNFIVKFKREFPKSNIDQIFFTDYKHEMCL